MPKVKNTKYRVQINSLPEGFELIDGELVKKAHGGHVTGDQDNYGLTTFNPHANESMGPKDTDVRYSLSSVPRDMANIEAEGGETVLTDLNNDGQFGLYDITGPRHSSGGVPMFLPEQSFIYSDTQKMKMGKEMLAEHGIKSRKKMTPAKVSKQYDLNKYYGILNDEYADKIQANTADLMLQKNKEGLSKLAFGQELMKDFEDGVPLAAYPYIQSIGMDPFDFASKVEGLKQFTGDQQAQPMNEADMQAMNPMAEYGIELAKAQFAGDPTQLANYMNTSPGQDYFNQLAAPMDYASSRNIVADAQMQSETPGLGATPYQQMMESLANENVSFGTGNQIASPTVTRDRGNLATRLDRGITNLMSSPVMKGVAETSTLLTDLADFGNEAFKNIKGQQAREDLLKMGMADNAFGTVDSRPLDTGTYDENTGNVYAIMQGRSPYGGNASYMGEYGMEIPMAQDGQETREWDEGDTLVGGSDVWVKWYMSDDNEEGRKKRYETYKILEEAKGVKPKDIVDEKTFHDTYVRAQRQINAIQDLYKDDQASLKSKEWDSYYGYKGGKKNWKDKRGKNWRYKEAIQKLNDKIKAENPNLSDDDLNKLLFKTLDDSGIKLFQSAYQATQAMDVATNDEFLSMVQQGLDDQTWTGPDGKVYTISPSDEFFGNTTVGQWEQSVIKGLPCPACPDGSVPQRDENGECPCKECPPCPEGSHKGTPTAAEPCPCIKDVETPEVPDVEDVKAPPMMEPWIQDIIKSQAIADRERDMFLPWEPAVRRPSMEVMLEDPNRAINAANALYGATAQALGAFGGKSQLMANLTGAAGQTADNVANLISGVNARNVATVNQANQINANLEAQANQLEDASKIRQYDNTQKVLQTYMDEKNFDREQYADAQANLITNMANTYNVNQLYDYFNIDPLRGGAVEQSGAKAWQPTPEQDEWAFMNNYMEAAKRAKAAGLVDKEGNVSQSVIEGLLAQKMGQRNYTDPREEAWRQQYRNYMAGAQPMKKGGEKKMAKWAVPFYTGKMGV